MKEEAPRIVLIATWSYFNKGDMLVLASTIDLVRKVCLNGQISIVAPDSESYAWASRNDRCFRGIDVHPTPTRIRPFRDVKFVCSNERRRFVLSLFESLPSPFWLAILVCFLLIFPILYLKSEFRKTLRTLIQASLILWCSGNLFFAPKGYGLRSTFEEMFTLFLCKTVMRKTVIFAPISLGPVQSATTRYLLKNLLNKADYVSLRENASYEYVRAIGVTNRNIRVSTDSAFLYEHELSQGRPDSKTPLVIGVTPILPTSLGTEATRRYLGEIAGFLRKLTEKGSRIILLPFSTIECDATAADHILNSLGSVKNVVMHELTYVKSEELLRRVSEVDVLVAMRLHSVIVASLLGIPSIAVVGQKNKSWGILRQLRMEDYALDLESLTEDDLEHGLSRLLQDMDTIKAKLGEIVPRMREDAASLGYLLKAFLPYSTCEVSTRACSRSSSRHLGSRRVSWAALG